MQVQGPDSHNEFKAGILRSCLCAEGSPEGKRADKACAGLMIPGKGWQGNRLKEPLGHWQGELPITVNPLRPKG